MVEIGLSWVLLAGVYLALAGGFSLQEAAAALLCGGLGAIWVRQLGRCGDHDLHIRTGALSPLIPASARLPLETVRVGMRLARAAFHGDVSGADRAVLPEDAARCPLGGDEPSIAGARAVSVLAASLSPDAYVLRLEPERGRIRIHSILPAGGGAS